jgi:hypothetical protein
MGRAIIRKRRHSLFVVVRDFSPVKKVFQFSHRSWGEALRLRTTLL